MAGPLPTRSAVWQATLPGHRMVVLALLALLALLATLLPPAAATASGSTPAAPEGAVTVPEALTDTARIDGQVAVLVALDVPTRPEGLLAPSAADTQRAAITAAQDDVVAQLSADAVLRHRYDTIPFLAATVDAEDLAALAAAPGVTGVTADEVNEPLLSATMPPVQAPTLHTRGERGQGQVVAILDTGVDRTHPAFAPSRVVNEACFASTGNDPDVGACPNGRATQTGAGAAAPLPSNVLGFAHGTHVAAIAAGRATGQSASGVADGPGAAPDADIMAIQVFQDNGGQAGASTSDIIAGLEYVAAQAADGVPVAAANLSLGQGGSRSAGTCDGTLAGQAYRAVAATLASRGVATIAASGNTWFRDSIGLPACVSNITAVGASTVPGDFLARNSPGATDDPPDVALYANVGPTIDLLAPGNIVAAVPGGGVSAFNGTSMAAPVVAGAWAVLQNANPTRQPPAEILAALKGTADPLRDNRPANTDPRCQPNMECAPFNGQLGSPSSGTYPQIQMADAFDTLAGEDPEPPDPDPVPTDRLAGADRILTSVELSRRVTSSDSVVIAQARNYADALAGAPLAAALGAPILLTERDALPQAVATEIRRLGAQQVHLLGGRAAVSQTVENQLVDMGMRVTRYSGSDRFGTARMIARRLNQLPGQTTTHAYVVLGQGADGWPDAVSVSALASYTGRPILPVRRDQLPAATAEALRDLPITSATIVGGSAVVSPTVESQVAGLLPGPVTRIAGSNRYDTSQRVANASLEAGMSPARTWIATGTSFPDALAAGPIAGSPHAAMAGEAGVLILVHGQDVTRSPEALSWARTNAAAIDRVRAAGGTASLSNDTLTRFATAAGSD